MLFREICSKFFILTVYLVEILWILSEKFCFIFIPGQKRFFPDPTPDPAKSFGSDRIRICNTVSKCITYSSCVQVEEFGVISNTRLINTCSMIVKNKFSYAFSGMDFPYRVAVHLFSFNKNTLISLKSLMYKISWRFCECYIRFLLKYQSLVNWVLHLRFAGYRSSSKLGFVMIRRKLFCCWAVLS